MLYVTASVWLVVVVLMAWGVHHLWCGLTRPRTLNILLLPGTVAAQLGRIIGLLITGATLNGTASKAEKDVAERTEDPGPQPKIPVVGPILVGLAPLVVLCAMIQVVATWLGSGILAKIPHDQIQTALPTTLAAFWEQLRRLITLCESTLNAVWTSDASSWRLVLFVYLMICLTVRLAPFPGNLRGHIGAVGALGMAALLAGSLAPGLPEAVAQAWPLLCLTVGWLMLLLFISLVARGAVNSARLFLKWE